MTVDPGTAISVSDRFCRIFLYATGTACFCLLGLNFNTLHDLPLSTVPVCLSVCPSVRTPVSNFSVYNDNSTPNYMISLGNIVILDKLDYKAFD